jgi:hypothetical protein
MDRPAHSVTLLGMLEAAHALRLADALPRPRGISTERLRQAGGMRPWLRLALGEETAAWLAGQNRAGWWLGALIGDSNLQFGTGHAKDGCLLAYDPAEKYAMMAVDALCSDAGSPRWSSWFSVRGRMPRAEAELMTPLLAASDDGPERSLPLLDVMEELLDGIAARFGLNPRKEAADLSAWTERTVSGTARNSKPAEYYAHGGGVKLHEQRRIALDDGGEVWLYAGDHLLWPGRFGPNYGDRLELVYHGVTPWHPGYLGYVRKVDVELEAFSRFIRTMDEAKSEPAVVDRATDDEGRVISEGDDVHINCDCLETRQGTRGRVLEILSDMAIVDFGHRGARKVPCYGHALSLVHVPVDA